MDERPCGNPACGCCYPEFTCYCSDRPADVEVGTVYACDKCGKISEAVALNSIPNYERIVAPFRRHGYIEPRLAWRTLVGATRLPGSL